MASSSLSNVALNYINFPTKVVFRSSKLIPTMGIAVFFFRKKYKAAEWLSALCVCIGLACVGIADATSLGEDFRLLGIVLVSLSVIADSATPNLQQRLFNRGESRADIVFITNLVNVFCMLVALTFSGDIRGALSLAVTDPVLGWYMTAYAFISYIAVSFHMSIVQKFGGVVGVLVGNARKLLTILISFFVFPKPITPLYIIGVVLSLGGLTAAMIFRDQPQQTRAQKQTHQNNTNEGNNNGPFPKMMLP